MSDSVDVLQLPIIHIDFETYYSGTVNGHSLKKKTTEQYVRSPEFETIGVGVLTPAGDLEFLEHAEFKEYAMYTDWSKYAVNCHNTAFDALICSHHYGTHPAFLYDTLSMGAALHGTQVGGSLRALMGHYAVGFEKGTEVGNVSGMHRADFTKEAWDRYGVYCCTDVRGTAALLKRMLVGFPASELKLIDLTLRMFTSPKLVLDEALMKKALGEEQARKQALLAKVAGEAGVAASDPTEFLRVIKSSLMSNDKFAELLIALGVEPPMKYSKKKERMDYAFAKTDPGFQALTEHDNPEVCALADARLGVKSTINETRIGRLLKAGKDGQPVPMPLRYCAAHTTRFGGQDKINVQNLSKTDEKDPSKGAIRRALRAPPGYKIVAADSAAIEARGLAFLAGQEDLVKAFQLNRDVYSEFASDIYGRPVNRKTKPEDVEPGFVAKTAVLGLGYGMGFLKFAATMLSGDKGPPVIFGEKETEIVDADVADKFLGNKNNLEKIRNMPSRLPFEQRLIHCIVAHDIVKKYRKRNSQITGFWKQCDEILESMVHGGGYQLKNTNGETIISTVQDGIVLPSGLTMHYPEIRYSERREVEEDEVVVVGEEWKNDSHYSYYDARTKKRSKVYGGLITENIIQAISRCIVTDQMLAFSDVVKTVGGQVVLMVHDEIVAVVPDEHAKVMSDELIRLMKIAPKWAEGIPLGAEGGYDDVYGNI